jgi:DNA (cytosine-5)-methyltransferase 1
VAAGLNAKGGSGRMDFDSETFVTTATLDASYGRLQGCSGQDANHGHSHLVPIAFSAKDHGADAQEDLSPTLRAGGHAGSHANAGVMPAVAIGADCWNGSTTGEVAATLGTRGSSETASGPTLLQAMRVRRLTVRECERLQGFEDDYTLVPYGRPSKAKLDADFLKYQLRGNPKHLKREDLDRLAADGPRYKALGNSWAVPNVRWIGRRIEAVRLTWAKTEPASL